MPGRKTKVTLRFTNRNGTHETKSYIIYMTTTSNGEAFEKAFEKYLKYHKDDYENIYSPDYHRPCKVYRTKLL